MSDQTSTTSTTSTTDAGESAGQTWVAVGPAGTVGSIGRTGAGFVVRLAGRSEQSGEYPTLAVAKSALFAALGPGADYPEFREH
ncbi:methyltransferase [Frigoribacterium sp. ACAM 257]|uniref:methyltransferase n=1 Tax=Frigoribacterium sp. ACAM 257 TaxID=2508998 RepID=UPI0011B9DD79|nr:methyltransferase [Frigoribacterium sp. ACAM 257]TWX37268.1 methyltransferase [Frigoribacterium sp. ACAM 257]